VTAASAALRVSRPALSSLLNGKADLSGDMALRIEKAFGVKMDTLSRPTISPKPASARNKSTSAASPRHKRGAQLKYDGHMLRYHVAFFLPQAPGGMVVAEALDFPGAVSQGFDLPDARLMIASAMEDLAQLLLEDGKPLPTPTADAPPSDADLIELVPLSVHVGAHRV
jgi:predicted RNase H-like HicB family nuclease